MSKKVKVTRGKSKLREMREAEEAIIRTDIDASLEDIPPAQRDTYLLQEILKELILIRKGI